MATPHLDRNEQLERSHPPDSWYGGASMEDLQELHENLQAERRRARYRTGDFYLSTSRGKRRVITVKPDPRYL